VFSRASLPLVQSFECGNEGWATEVSDWLKADHDGAADAVEQDICSVWLYYTDEKEFVGYASLGLSLGRWNVPGYPRSRVPIVPFFGICSAFQGQPENAQPLDRYAALIMRDVVYQATRFEVTPLPLLGLMCHHLNSRAIRFYERLGYVPLDPADGSRDYVRMVVRLPAEIELA
jgi:hypothetical protein